MASSSAASGILCFATTEKKTADELPVDQRHCAVEIQTTHSMGNGLFAIEDIARGTQILAEVPILAIPPSSQRDMDDDIPAFCAALQDLPKAEWKKLDELHCNTTLVTLARRAKIREWYKEKGITDTNGVTLKGKKLQDVAKAATRRFATFLSNRVQMGPRGECGSGIFSFYSRINHSCAPNVHNAYNPGIQRLTLYSIRDIRAGEQITTSYINSACRTREQRRQETENWGFVCSCLACTDATIEPLRARTFELDQRFALYESPWGGLSLLWTSPMARKSARSAAISGVSEALKDAEELAELLKKQGLEGMALGQAYVHRLFKACRPCGQQLTDLGTENAPNTVSNWDTFRRLWSMRRRSLTMSGIVLGQRRHICGRIWSAPNTGLHTWNTWVVQRVLRKCKGSSELWMVLALYMPRCWKVRTPMSNILDKCLFLVYRSDNSAGSSIMPRVL